MVACVASRRDRSFEPSVSLHRALDLLGARPARAPLETLFTVVRCPRLRYGLVAFGDRSERMKASDVCAVVFVALSSVASPAWAQVPGPNNAITDVPGISVGHFTGHSLTGTTVVRAEHGGQGVAGGVSQRGGAPGTRETDLLKPENMVQIVNAITLSGGSAYGLAAASGVMQCLESQGVGFPVPGGVVPIVPTAILFDPGRCGAPFNSRPNFSFGLNACSAARSGPVQEGNVGAGAGAVSGGVKGGLGTASVVLDKGVIVGAIVAVNSVGSTFDANGNLYAAPLELAGEFGNLIPIQSGPPPGMSRPAAVPGGLLRNTTIAVVATNVELTKTQATKIAQMADDGLARAIKDRKSTRLNSSHQI